MRVDYRFRLLALVALSGVCSAGWAQLVTPPPAANPAIDANIPKAPPPPEVMIPPPSPPPVRAQPVKKEPIPALPWKEWEKDSKGIVLVVSEPIELAALRRNPYVTPEMMSKIEAYLPERQKSVQRIVIDNLDLVEKVDNGAFERVNLTGGDKGGIGELVGITKPLSTTRFALDLKNRNIIDDKAAGFNSTITSAYDKAMTPADKSDATKEEKNARAGTTMRLVLKNTLSEHMWNYNHLLELAAKDLPGYKADATPAEKIAQAKAALAKMSVEDRKDLLRKVAGLPKPEAKAVEPAKADGSKK